MQNNIGREGKTHIKSVFLGVGPLKTTFFYQLKKLPKPHEPLSTRGGGGRYPDLSGPTSKKKSFLCVSSLSIIFSLFSFDCHTSRGFKSIS